MNPLHGLQVASFILAQCLGFVGDVADVVPRYLAATGLDLFPNTKPTDSVRDHAVTTIAVAVAAALVPNKRENADRRQVFCLRPEIDYSE